MPVESPADLAGMFDTEEWAEAASYQAPGGGDPVDCTVILDRGQGRMPMEPGEQRVAVTERMLWVQKGELAAIVRNGIFTIEADGEQLKVQGVPELDHAGTLWSCRLLVVE